MSDIDVKLAEVKDELYSDPVLVEYFRLKDMIEHDEELMNLEKEVRLHQKKMCENIDNDEIYLLEKELYETYSSQLRNNPLVINFNLVKDDAVKLLKEVKEYLE